MQDSTNRPVQIVGARRLCHGMPQSLASIHRVQHLCRNRRVGQWFSQMNAVFPREKSSDVSLFHPSKAVEKLKTVTFFKRTNVFQRLELPNTTVERKMRPVDAPDPWVFFEIRFPFWRARRADVLVQNVRRRFQSPDLGPRCHRLGFYLRSRCLSESIAD